jgi:hypothetical protein
VSEHSERVVEFTAGDGDAWIKLDHHDAAA